MRGGAMRTITGDLIVLAKAGAFDVIAHGCNCFHTMGGGIAAQIRQHFPEAFAADVATPYGARAKLGTCSVATVSVAGGHDLTIVNAYTQFEPSGGSGGVDVDYGAVAKAMAWIGAHYSGKRIGLPMIGAGLAGGDWATIEVIIRDALGGEDVTIVRFGGGT
jgi:O-acetyl-ADP-ribose deacetylase (regulator of RNase III)